MLSPLHGPALQSSHKLCVGATINNSMLPEPEAKEQEVTCLRYPNYKVG